MKAVGVEVDSTKILRVLADVQELMKKVYPNGSTPRPLAGTFNGIPAIAIRVYLPEDGNKVRVQADNIVEDKWFFEADDAMVEPLEKLLKEIK